jgi:hypothetical protein
MDELELSLSGLAKDSTDKVSGKLLIANLILTGTLSENMGEWDNRKRNPILYNGVEFFVRRSEKLYGQFEGILFYPTLLG